MNRIDRLFAMLLVLQTRQRVRAEDLAKQFEISQRTVEVLARPELRAAVLAEAQEVVAMLKGD